MSYRAGVSDADMAEARKLADEMEAAAGWAVDDWQEADLRDAYRAGVIDTFLRSKGYDVFG